MPYHVWVVENGDGVVLVDAEPEFRGVSEFTISEWILCENRREIEQFIGRIRMRLKKASPLQVKTSVWIILPSPPFYNE